MREKKATVNLPLPLSDKKVKKEAKKEKQTLNHCLSFIKSCGHSTKTEKLLLECRKKAFSIYLEMMKNRLLPYYLIELSPSVRQLKIFDEIFAAPSSIQELIDSLEEKEVESKNFLLEHKSVFYGLIGKENWNRFYTFLKMFVDLYKLSDMVDLELPMADGCSLSASNKVYISSLSIGLVNAYDEKKVMMVRGWRETQGIRYLTSFSLVKFNGKYFAKVKYQESDYYLRMNKDLTKEIQGTMEVLAQQRHDNDIRESRSFSRVEISESTDFLINDKAVNHAHRRDPRKKWS